MSISPEPSKHQPVPAKKEIKTEECSEFLQKVEVDETPGLEHGGTTEILTFQSFNVKEEKLSPVQVKEEEESNLKEYGHYNSSPSGHEVDERPELEHEWTTEMPTSVQLTCEEEAYCAVEIKEEIKEEDCHEDISVTIQEEKSGIEQNWNTVTSPQLSCKEEVEEDTYVPVEIKQEEIEEEHFREYGYDSPCKSHWKFKELSEDLKKRIVALHEDGLGYKRIGRALRLSCSTVAKIMQRFKRNGSVQNKPRHGRPKKLSERTLRHIQRMSSRRMSAASIAAEVEAVGGQPVSVQTIRRKLHQIGLLSSQKEASSKDTRGDIDIDNDPPPEPKGWSVLDSFMAFGSDDLFRNNPNTTRDALVPFPRVARAKAPLSSSAPPGGPASTAPEMKDPCGQKCRRQCTAKFSEGRRKEIWSCYWDMDYAGKRLFVFHSVGQLPTARSSVAGSRRCRSFVYRLENEDRVPQQVCKTFFLATLGYHPTNDSLVHSVMGREIGNELSLRDRRGRHPPANKLDLRPVFDHIESFHPSLSRYGREQATRCRRRRRYLPRDITIKLMYADYVEKGNRCSYETYRKAVKQRNIGFCSAGKRGNVRSAHWQ